jgi:hypothetical protein
VGAGADFQVDIRLRHPKVLKEGFAHPFVIVLSSVNENELYLIRIIVHGCNYRGNFHEIGASSHNVNYFHTYSNKRFISAVL